MQYRKIWCYPCLAVVMVGATYGQSNIDADQKWSWGENIGWMNWRDANGTLDGVRVAATYLGGWIWCENVGWMTVGDGTPADGSMYLNADANDFGVNIDPSGDLVGFGWAENVGWVNFDTSVLGPERARYDAGVGRFRGWAWGENVGWINLDDADHFVATTQVCADGNCSMGEDSCNCPDDCGPPDDNEEPGVTCDDGLDNDCDGDADCADSDCAGDVLSEGEFKLTAGDASGGDFFGTSVSISGDTVVVGANRDTHAGTDSGSAYIFQRDQGGADNWGEFKKLIADDASLGDYFGISVSISGDTVVVGARFDDDGGSNSGSAYIFQRDAGGADNWGEVAKLTADDAAGEDYFGTSVSISGDTVVVGANRDTHAGTDSGSAYVFVKPAGGWVDMTETAKLIASDASLGDYFGISVSISDDSVVVGARFDDDGGSNSGSAYVFRRDQGGTDNWGEVAKLTASDAAGDDYFGTSVSISGDTVVVGANRDTHAGTDSGSAYAFVKPADGWVDMTETAKLTAADASLGDYFGISVSISGPKVVVGARFDDDGGSNSGSAYIFRRVESDPDNWDQIDKMTAEDASGDDYFGTSISISGDKVVVGASNDDDAGSDSGSAYVFYSPSCGDGGCFACENSCTCPGDCGPPDDNEEPGVTCDDGLDNDCDGEVDCDDLDCLDFPPCLDCNLNGTPDVDEGTKTLNFCVKCSLPSPPNDCSDGTQWSFLLDWLGAGPNFENLDCGPVIPTEGTTASDMAAEFVDCISPTVCPSITVTLSGESKCFKVTVPGTVKPQICVGPSGGPSNACCPTPQSPCQFNPELFEVPLVETDCNGNGIDDAIDIFFETSEDCNGNTIPDECEELCVVDEDCDDGDQCTVDTCDCENPEAGGDGCVHEFQIQVYADICSPFDPPDGPQPDLDDILCELDDFADGASVSGCPGGCTGAGGPQQGTTDIHPCPEDGGGDGEIILDDILNMLDAFAGNAPCDDPCPG